MGRYNSSEHIVHWQDFSEASNGESQRQTAAVALTLIDRGRLRRECLRHALERQDTKWFINEASSVDEVLKSVVNGAQPDLIILGATTADHLDLADLQTLRDALPEVPVVVVADGENTQQASAILKAGARGFLPTTLSLRVLVGALDLVLAGGVYVPSTLLDPVAMRPAGTGPGGLGDPFSDLTRRQKDVLGLIAQGKSNKLIAAALAMSESTVKAHVKQIIKRLKVANRTQAALAATGKGSMIGQINRAPLTA